MPESTETDASEEAGHVKKDGRWKSWLGFAVAYTPAAHMWGRSHPPVFCDHELTFDVVHLRLFQGELMSLLLPILGRTGTKAPDSVLRSRLMHLS